MKKKSPSNIDVAEVVTKIQEQLAVLDRKLDAFMTKSLNELAQALAASKPAQVVHVSAPSSNMQSVSRPGRQMYAVVCFECGKDTEIPFKPSGDRPVFCKECFAKRRGQPAKVGEAKPQGFSLAASSNPSASTLIAGPKKKTAGPKKPAVKKRTAVKKSAKRK